MSINCSHCNGEGRISWQSNDGHWHYEECPYCLDDSSDEMNYSEVSRPYSRCWDDSWEPSTEDDSPW